MPSTYTSNGQKPPLGLAAALIATSPDPERELWVQAQQEVARVLPEQRQSTNVIGLAKFRQRNAPVAARYEPGRLTGPVKFLSVLKDRWHLQDSEACVLLGYEPTDSAVLNQFLSGQRTLQTRDAKDRIAYLIVISSILDAVFRNAETENRWLREPQPVLSDISPLQRMLRGSIEDLIRVKLLTEALGGR